MKMLEYMIKNFKDLSSHIASILEEMKRLEAVIPEGRGSIQLNVRSNGAWSVVLELDGRQIGYFPNDNGEFDFTGPLFVSEYIEIIDNLNDAL